METLVRKWVYFLFGDFTHYTPEMRRENNVIPAALLSEIRPQATCCSRASSLWRTGSWIWDLTLRSRMFCWFLGAAAVTASKEVKDLTWGSVTKLRWASYIQIAFLIRQAPPLCPGLVCYCSWLLHHKQYTTRQKTPHSSFLDSIETKTKSWTGGEKGDSSFCFASMMLFDFVF